MRIVVGEGLIDADGNYVSAAEATDAFGHAQLGGAGDYLKSLVLKLTGNAVSGATLSDTKGLLSGNSIALPGSAGTFTDTIIVRDQKTNESIPRTFSRVTGRGCAP